MIKKSLTTTFIVLTTASGIKATGVGLGMKLFIIACTGLAGMYMIHLLAQDYNKYQSNNRNGRSVHDIVRRSLDDIDFNEFNSENSTEYKKLIDDINEAEEHSKLSKMLSVNKILQFDPTGCARKYVCMISTKSFKKQSQSERNIIQMLRSLQPINSADLGQKAFVHAMDFGRLKKDIQACADEYPKCIFTVSQMLKLVGLFS